jgi:hypothetical protein
MSKMPTASRTASFWKARERQRTQDSATKDQMLRSVLEHMPAGFTGFDFLNAAVGLNAIDNAGDVDRFLQHLMQTGMITRNGNVYVRTAASRRETDSGPSGAAAG